MFAELTTGAKVMLKTYEYGNSYIFYMLTKR